MRSEATTLAYTNPHHLTIEWGSLAIVVAKEVFGACGLQCALLDTLRQQTRAAPSPFPVGLRLRLCDEPSPRAEAAKVVVSMNMSMMRAWRDSEHGHACDMIMT